jgi:hypothetical protein
MKYGRDETEWEELVAAGRRFLEERGRLQTTTSYTELNTVLAQRTGLQPFDFDREDGRAAMGYLLGLISEEAFDQIHALLSAVVQYLNENDAGPGFFDLAQRRGLLHPGAGADDKLAFWSRQVSAVHAYFRQPARRP